MNIDEIRFSTVCCGECHYAEITTTSGYASVYRDIHSGAYRIRSYGIDKMPISNESAMSACEFTDWLSMNT
ncbi:MULTISPECIES: hypothetical protein [Massilia]|uniref:Uncharacterized protein n=1 Tax=Massilia haematophila TaxID=457923 RepID=A0ABV7PNK7_9BURK|nr:hypothetical protein [Massilia sp.]